MKIKAYTPTQLTAVLGYSVKFQCRIVGKPKPTLQWYKNGKEITSNDLRMTISKEVLTISYVKEDDAGNYSCFASNGFDNITINYNLNVEALQLEQPSSSSSSSKPKPPNIVKQQNC